MARISKESYYLNIAREVSTRSTCLKRHYGCVIVKDDAIIATGYNGSPRGTENCCDSSKCKRENAKRYSDYELCDSVHAEQNALISASRSQLIGATLYLACVDSVTGEEDINPRPCSICERMIRNSGIINIVNRLESEGE